MIYQVLALVSIQLTRPFSCTPVGAPVVFPDCIVAVDSWTRRVEGDASAVLMVVVSKCDGQLSYKSLPVRTAPTANQARRQLGMEANEWIAQLIQTP